MSDDLTHVIPVILCGGNGSRLWPVSTAARPKQFQTMVGERSLLEETVERIRRIGIGRAPVLIGSERHAAELDAVARRYGGTALLEPVARNTGPAVALATHLALREGGSEVVLILPADHFVKDEVAFAEALRRAVGAAAGGRIVTLGIVPDRAATEYGWITPAGPLGDGAAQIAAFVEKPDAETARRLLSDGRHFWNAGMFVAKVDTLAAEFLRHELAMFNLAGDAVRTARRRGASVRLSTRLCSRFHSVPFDVAIMERSRRGAVVPAPIGWSDIGSWDAVWACLGKDDGGNATAGDVVLVDTRGALVRSQSKPIAVIGLEDVVVVESEDGILVGARDAAQTVKRIPDLVGASPQAEPVTGAAVRDPEALRPWGAYRALDRGRTFQVKHITVVPGGRLSLQYHHHRAEHWVVVAGTALVEIDGVERILAANESIYIPQGATHRLTNSTDAPLHLIEVQYGSYCGEDDIVRLEDVYGRAESPAGVFRQVTESAPAAA
ncbi:mannose-1-phosphate guanylyltransferase/mannose-6-phosphate isomerase [Rhodoplanes sp. TEM]|uniref:mannose-1-phosphate guanylyltransferase n=1 Tax=Rhodoplanes tepidamans TaxID=200616 RepID=A0ABT5JIM2_RHOTP|nr:MULTISPECIES: mannose-1-phosphate guanylyltransferase/mannose-6-phosphate isomerase [Rhodoplanes]MDC7789437.1 mannose-1-phosphate guanylyltransferase/mannose-6-phosphate isomerase [Rhodoplanes tepidamans]MDC7985426.1 mannose-1-phosphate guanylyltransferase/mannose-6-phosphate isomerase [Rhodoplanes sp. TEM]MDQ0353611.1 mannose-1-phosphate guanylyltransferase/mannose-6-phosphate isomerase [Rhodoplanes tepidamans]